MELKMSLQDALVEINNLKRLVEELRDREIIRVIKHRYCWETDGGWDEKGPPHTGQAADLFSDDAIWDARPLGPLSIGRKKIVSRFLPV